MTPFNKPLVTRLCVHFCLATCVNSATANSLVTEKVEPVPEMASSAHDRRILVTFHDEREDHISVPDPNSPYRRREDYGNSVWGQRVAEKLAIKYGLQQVAQWPITALHVHCVVYRVPDDQPFERFLQRLSRDPLVEGVQTMQQFHVMSGTYSDPFVKLQAGFRSMHVESVHHAATGHNIQIAIIDTGVDVTHPDLVGQVSESQNFVAESPETSTDIHGTAVAGIIAAMANNGKGIVGVAPGAQLISLKACWQSEARSPDAVCNTFTLALALNAAIIQKPQIINLSLSGPKDPLLERLLDKALDDGIIIVASDPAVHPSGEEFPSAVKNVIAVRTTESETAGTIARSGTITAPGTEILTTTPHAHYTFLSGSSFAAAHVSGLIALLLELNPTLTRQQIAAILHAAGRGTSKQRAQLPSVDACAAIASLRPELSCPKDEVLAAIHRPDGQEGVRTQTAVPLGK